MSANTASQESSTLFTRMFWIFALIWGPIAFVLGDRIAEDTTFRINDLEAIYGSGTIQRDFEGAFFHVNEDGMARKIFPELDPPIYAAECLDCRLVTGEQLSQTNDFCAVGKRSELPTIHFELPCRTWAVISDGTKAMAFLVFIAPLIVLGILRRLWVRTRRRAPA